MKEEKEIIDKVFNTNSSIGNGLSGDCVMFSFGQFLNISIVARYVSGYELEMMNFSGGSHDIALKVNSLKEALMWIEFAKKTGLEETKKFIAGLIKEVK